MPTTHSSLASRPVAFLLADLGVTKSHSRPHCNNGNPFSVARFKMLKYRPDFPERFGSLEDARAFCAVFYRWYNLEHRHSGIGMHTPFGVHHGRAGTVQAARTATLPQASTATPNGSSADAPSPAPARHLLDQPTRTRFTNPTYDMTQKG